MDDQDLREAGHDGVVEELADYDFCLVDHHAADVDLAANRLGLLHEGVRLATRGGRRCGCLRLLRRMVEEAAGRRLDLRVQGADLDGQLLALHLEHRALLVELLDVDDVAGLDALEAHGLADALLGHDARARLLEGLVELRARVLDGLLASLDALVVELLLELLDDGLAARAAHHRRALLARLADELALLLGELFLRARDLGLELGDALLALEDVGIALFVHHLLVLELIDDVLELRVVGLDELLRAEDQ